MNDEQFNEMMRRARGHEPFDTARTGYRLETRVLARMRDERAGASDGAAFADDLRKWIWRSAVGVTPAVALLVLWLLLWSGLTVESIAYDAVGDLAAYLPLD